MNRVQELDELIEKLSSDQEVECGRPSKTMEDFKASINRKYVHLMFKSTGTEVGVALNMNACTWEAENFSNGVGNVHLEGGLTLNYCKVKCTADLDLATCDGIGHLTPVSDEEYAELMRGH